MLLHRLEPLGALAVPPGAVFLVEGRLLHHLADVAVGLVAVFGDVREVVDRDGAGGPAGVLAETVARVVREGHGHRAAVADPGADEVGLVLVAQDRAVEDGGEILVGRRIGDVHVGARRAVGVGDEQVEVPAVAAAEHLDRLAGGIDAEPARAAAAGVFVERQEVDAGVGVDVDLGRPAVARVGGVEPVAAVGVVDVPVLVVAELQQVPGPGVEAELLHEPHLHAEVVVLVGVAGVGAVLAHLVAPGDVALRGVAGRVFDGRGEALLVVHPVEADRADRGAGRIGRVGRRKGVDDHVEAVLLGIDVGVRRVVGKDLLVEKHHLLEPLVGAGEGDVHRLRVRLADDVGDHRLADGDAGVPAVAGVHRAVEKARRARDVVRVFDDEQVHVVRDEPLALAEAVGEEAGLPARVRQDAAGAPEDRLDGGGSGGQLVELVRRVGGAVHLVHEREVAVGLEAGEDVRAGGGKGEQGEERKQAFHGDGRVQRK